MNESAYLDRQNPEFDKFLIQVNDNIKEREKEVELKKKHHLQGMRRMQILYYFLGIQITIYSTIVSFLSGIYTFKNFDWLTTTILTFALLSTVLNAILGFSNIVEKISKHRDSYNKYDLISNNIDRFKMQTLSEREIKVFFDLLDNTLGFVNEYEIINCCFENK